MGILFSDSCGLGSGAEQQPEARLSMEGAVCLGKGGRPKNSLPADRLVGEGDGGGEKIIAASQ